MAPEAVVAERAYQQLKGDVVSGRFAPGTQIVERTLATEYGLSIAPLRDAAQRLVGEGLLEPGWRGGFRIPPVTQSGLRDLYQWHSHLVRLSVTNSKARLELGTDVIRQITDVDGEQAANAATALFRAFAVRSVSTEVARALMSANDRLHPIRLKEKRVLTNLGAELQTVLIATTSGSDQNRLAALWAYHRRRLRRVSSISRCLNE